VIPLFPLLKKVEQNSISYEIVKVEQNSISYEIVKVEQNSISYEIVKVYKVDILFCSTFFKSGKSG
jgi:hypothetical protein